MDYLNEARDFFENDIFSTKVTGITIEAVNKNYAKCFLKLEHKHMNALNTPMGGAIYTLADFTFAIASNIGNVPTVTKTSKISFLKASKGSVLISEAELIKEEGLDCFFAINIIDDLDIKVAEVIINGKRISQKKNKYIVE